MIEVCVVLTNRASYARVAEMIREMVNSPEIEISVIVHASANMKAHGDIVDQLMMDGVCAIDSINTLMAGGDGSAMVKTTGLATIELTSLLDGYRPDYVITVADRFETIATAIAASYLNIPLIHIQGGEQTGSIDDKVRNAITQLADFHFVATTKAKENVQRMVGDKGMCYQVGCPSLDTICRHKFREPRFPIDEGLGPRIDPAKPYLLVLLHPVTTEDALAHEQMWHTINAVQETGMQAVWLWPNIDAGSDGSTKALREYRELFPEAPIHFYRHLPHTSFLDAMHSCACMVGNSSAGIREGSFLGIPVVNIGSRQQGRERSENVIDVGFNEEQIIGAINEQITHGRYFTSTLYGNGSAGRRITQILTGCRVRDPSEVN